MAAPHLALLWRAAGESLLLCRYPPVACGQVEWSGRVACVRSGRVAGVASRRPPRPSCCSKGCGRRVKALVQFDPSPFQCRCCEVTVTSLRLSSSLRPEGANQPSKHRQSESEKKKADKFSFFKGPHETRVVRTICNAYSLEPQKSFRIHLLQRADPGRSLQETS